MYVAVRPYEGVTDSRRVAQQVREGFVAYYLVDAGDGVMVSTSVFERKDAEEQPNFRAGAFTAERIAPLSPNAPQVTAGGVVAYGAG